VVSVFPARAAPVPRSMQPCRPDRLFPARPLVRATSENTAPEAEAEPDDAEHPGPDSVPDDADRSGEISEINSPSAHAPLTQTAPDEESEAE
jgi:hypothetical protein